MLHTLLFALVLVATGPGCSSSSLDAGSSEDDGAGEPPDGSGGGQAPAECGVPEDCEAAASTCCECPSFAVPAGSGLDQSCSEVECGPMNDCPLVEPACQAGRCELVCAVVEATQSCEAGFARDTFGCLIDGCNDEPDAATGCSNDDECVQVPGDCCGCARGGSDTAVLASEQDEFAASLDCQPREDCPQVDVCDPSDEPRCVAGRCQLVSASTDPDGQVALCGFPDAPACEPGTVCVLNHPDALHATAAGVGSCQPL